MSAANTIKPWGYWFQQSHEGLILFVVFYAKACRWEKCTGCNLPAQMSANAIPLKDQLAQIDWLFAQADVIAAADKIVKVIVSNNGSVLDEVTFASTTLIYLVASCNKYLPKLQYLTLETRAEYVDTVELAFLARVLKEGEIPTKLELAVGVEIFDEKLRNKFFLKGLTNNALIKLVEKMAEHGFALKGYFMQKPIPEMTDESAKQDVVSALQFFEETATKYNVPISMHLNPAYGAKGTKLGEAFLEGRWKPTSLRHVAQAIVDGRALAPHIPIFVGLSDEGLALPGSSFTDTEDFSHFLPVLTEWNKTQRVQDLEVALAANIQP